MRAITEQESRDIITPLTEKEKFVVVSDHRSFPYKGLDENFYRFTINIMSLDLLISLMEHEKVKNVFFTAAAPGPGQGMDGVSMNYKVYVQYHPIKD
tara:strand:- start:247 stop:537 length:291 start_codon:yes stop_codon:yes gene_type:complete